MANLPENDAPLTSGFSDSAPSRNRTGFVEFRSTDQARTHSFFSGPESGSQRRKIKWQSVSGITS